MQEPQAFHFLMQIIVVNIYLTFSKLDKYGEESTASVYKQLNNQYLHIDTHISFTLIKIIDENFRTRILKFFNQ